MLQVAVVVIVALLAFVSFVIIKDIRSRKPQKPEYAPRNTRKPSPPVRTRPKRKEPKSQEEPIRKPQPPSPVSDSTPELTPEPVTQTPPPDTKQTVIYTWSCTVPKTLPCPVICTESIAYITKKEKTRREETTPPPAADESYAPFSHQRLIDMGLSEEDAKAFVQELIPQIEEQLPLLEQALEEEDYHKMERLTHSIKGSSTNIGTGGVADVLVDYNTYLKEGNDKRVAAGYLATLRHYLAKLKARYLS